MVSSRWCIFDKQLFSICCWALLFFTDDNLQSAIGQHQIIRLLPIKKCRHSSLFALEWKFFSLVTRKTLVTFMTSVVIFVTKEISTTTIYTFDITNERFGNLWEHSILHIFALAMQGVHFIVKLFFEFNDLYYQPSVCGFSIGPYLHKKTS